MKTSPVLLASTLTLLAACSAPSAPGPAQTTTGNGAVYQVDFKVASDTQASAIIHKINPSLAAQSLENIPNDVSINFTSMSTSTFVAKQNSVDMRHIHTTLAVTNNTGQTLTNLTFLPVIRTDNDSDPANNTQTPTISGTPFMNMRLYDGSNADSQASAMTLTQAKEVNLTTREVILNTQASPYIGSLDVSGLTAAVDSGLSTTVMNSGWVAATSLASGDTGYVTFAVEIPVDRTQPKTQPFSFSLLVTEAQDVTGSAVGSSLDPARVQGVIAPWTFGANEKLHAYYYPDYIDRNSTGAFQSYDFGDIAASGAVNSVLPTPDTVNLESLLKNCTFTGTRTAPNIGYTLAYLSAVTVGGDRLGSVAAKTADGRRTYPFYSDTDARLKGTAQCAARRETMNLDLTVKRGWNNVTMVVIENADGSLVTTFGNIAPGDRTALRFAQTDEAADVLFADNSTLSLTPGVSVTRNVKLLQRGGISGDITLETDVPGVSVSPSTLTLPSFSTQSTHGISSQSVGAQSLSPALTFTASETAAAFNGALSLIIKKGGVEIGRGQLYLDLTIPYIYGTVEYPYNSSYSPTKVAQEETVSIPVRVYGQNGFNGTTTVTLTNLPPGITASSPSVTLASGNSTAVTIDLTVSSGTALGDIMLKLSGPKYQQDRSYSEVVYLRVVPSRTALNFTSSSSSLTAVAARNGSWIMDKYNNTFPTEYLLKRVQGNAVVQQQRVADTGLSSVYTRSLLATPQGNAVSVVSGSNSNSSLTVVTAYSPQGQQASYSIADPFNSNNIGGGVVDASNTLWFTNSDFFPLKKLNLNTGEVFTFMSSQSSGGPPGTLTMSADGQMLTILRNGENSSSGNYMAYALTRIDTSSQTLVSTVALSRQLGSFDARDVIQASDGSLYLLESYSSLVRIAPDGQVTALVLGGTTDALTHLYGIDRAKANVLWASTTNGIVAVDLNTLSVSKKDMQIVVAATVEGESGLTEVVSANSYSYGPYYASHLTP